MMMMKPALRKPSRAHSVVGSRQATAAKAARQCPVVRAESSAEVSRRGALVALTGAAAAVSSSSQAALAAYGERATVPGKWNPTKEVEYPGQQVRYEDNYDTVSSLYVSKIPSSKGNIKDYGEPLKFLEQFSDVLGKQSYQGSTASEGGFDKNRVSVATIVSADAVERNGITYYKINILTRTADGNEGGRHQLVSAGVGKDKNLYIMKVQMGEKRWVKGGAKDPYGAWDSFTITA